VLALAMLTVVTRIPMTTFQLQDCNDPTTINYERLIKIGKTQSTLIVVFVFAHF